MMLILGLPLGFFATGIFAGMGALLTESYPTAIRGSGQGFTYNFGRGIASLNPTLVGLLGATLPLGQSIGVFALVAYGFVIAAVLMLPETKGQVLTANAT
jgi:MFS family permease